MTRLGVNIDHVATLRQVRKATYPDPITAAALAELGQNAGAAVSILARRSGASELLAGQAIDLTETPQTLAAIERLHAAKTGALFAAAAELGAISAGAPATTCAASSGCARMPTALAAASSSRSTPSCATTS